MTETIMYICFAVIIATIVYIFISIRVKVLTKRRINDIEKKTQGMFDVLVKEIKLLKVDVLHFKKGDNVYTELSRVYDFEIEYNRDKINNSKELLNFLHSKFAIINKIITFMVKIHNQIIVGEKVSISIIEKDLEKARVNIKKECDNELGHEFSVINSEANNECFDEAKSLIIKILIDKTKNNKIDRLLQVACKLLSKSMRITINSYDKYVENKADKHKQIETLINNCDFNKAALLILELSNNKGDIVDLIHDIVEYDIKRAGKLESRSQLQNTEIFLKERLKDIHEKIKK